MTGAPGGSALLGLDIGGSRVRARLQRADGRLVDAEAGGANPAAVGLELAERQLARLLTRLGNPEVASCCAGAAGAELPRFREGLAATLEKLLPGCQVSVVHDARLVLAAAGLEQGIVLIAGTGSVGYGRGPTGIERWAGGWGWMLGDDGSACWLVREAARDLLRVTDEDGAPGAMGHALLRAAGCASPAELRERLAAWRRPEQWAQLAPAIFEAAPLDAAAQDLVARGASLVAGLAGQVARTVGEAGPVVLAGGLHVGQPLMNELVREALDLVFPRTPVTTLDRPPVHGALRLAGAIARR